MSTGHRRRFSPRVLPGLHPVCAKKMLDESANQKLDQGWAASFCFSFLLKHGIISGAKDDSG